MSRSPLSLTTVAAALALLGCAAPAPQQIAGGAYVRPVQSVRHGADAQANYRTGRYFQGQVRFDEAIEAYCQALASQPDHADALNALGVIYSLQNRPDLAEQSFRAALEAAPQSAQIHNNLGYHLMANGRVQEALAAFEQARTLEPENEFAAVNLAAARNKLGLGPEAPQQQTAQALQAPAPAPQKPTAVLVEVVPAAASMPNATAPLAPAAQLERVSEAVWTLRSSPPAVVASPSPAAPPVAVAGSPVAAPSASSPPAIEAYPRSAIAAAATPAQAQPGRIEIANGNGMTGLARRLSALLAPQGFLRARLTNDRPFGVARSRIQYVNGAEQMAREINASLPVQLPLARVEGLERNARVRVLLGKDFPPQAAYIPVSTRSNS